MGCRTKSAILSTIMALVVSPMGCSDDPPDDPDCAENTEECLEDLDCCEGLSCQWGVCGVCTAEGEYCDMSPECCAGLVCAAAYCEPAFDRDYGIQITEAAMSMSRDGVLWDADEPSANQAPDPYVVVTIGDQTFETAVAEDSIAPTFSEIFEAHIDVADIFHVALYDADDGEDELVIEYPVGVPANIPIDYLRQGGMEVRAQSEGFTAVVRLGFFPR